MGMQLDSVEVAAMTMYAAVPRLAVMSTLVALL